MIPINLCLRGINSYQKEFNIDFSKLTKGQLFGIFGPVGSGKSTILEAISLALYGETERLHQKENRNYNLMNLRSDELFIDFIFQAGHTADEYRFVASAKRNKKQFEKVNAIERKAYKKEEEEWLPIAPSSIEQIIGLSYKNFRRTIIIPQGKFQEFLQLGAKDRTQMLKEIFGLEKFDLQYKVASLERVNSLKKEKLEGGLQQLANVSSALLKEQKKQFKELAIQLDHSEKKIKLYHEVQLAFHKKFDFTLRVAGAKTLLEEKLKELKLTKKELHLLERGFESLKLKYESRDKLKRKKEELERTRKINTKSREIEKCEKRIKMGEAVLKENAKKLKDCEKSIKEKRALLAGLKKSLPDISKLTDLEKWFAGWKVHNANLAKQKSELLQVQKKLTTLNLQPPSGLEDLQSAQEYLFVKKEELRHYLEELSHRESHMQLQTKMEDMAKGLVDEQPCPLCGSLHHPNIYSGKKTKNDLKEIGKQLNKLRKELEELNKSLHSFEMIKENIQSSHLEIKKREGNFPSKDYSLEDEKKVDVALREARRINGLIEKEEKRLDELRDRLDKERKSKDSYEKGIREIQESLTRLQAEKQTLVKHLKIVDIVEYAGESDANLELHIYELDNEINDIEWNYKKDEETLRQLRKKEDTISGHIESETTALAKLEKEDAKHNQNISALLSGAEYPVLKGLAVLAQEQRATEKSSVFQKFETEVSRLEVELKEHRNSYLELKTETKRLEKDLREKKKLQTGLEKLIHRAENIRLLKNLFKGSGFVDYISSIYLQELCEAANERFYKLSRQQLKLEITAKNNFIVRDFLNQGRTRSAKTLSGGQIFQASLSLALSLAESIRKQNQAGHNFFFMDEGFGSQDDESLQLVLKTLKALRKENRTVGIISHVEGLKQEIDVYLTVENDPEKGSNIKASWEG